jgi:hypothetical protein
MRYLLLSWMVFVPAQVLRSETVIYDVNFASPGASLTGTISADVATDSFITSDLGFTREAQGTFIRFPIVPPTIPVVQGSLGMRRIPSYALSVVKLMGPSNGRMLIVFLTFVEMLL